MFSLPTLIGFVQSGCFLNFKFQSIISRHIGVRTIREALSYFLGQCPRNTNTECVHAHSVQILTGWIINNKIKTDRLWLFFLPCPFYLIDKNLVMKTPTLRFVFRASRMICVGRGSEMFSLNFRLWNLGLNFRLNRISLLIDIQNCYSNAIGSSSSTYFLKKIGI